MKNQKTGKNFKTLKRLLKNESGNTIIFMGAALIPLLAVIGGGIDASRGYMAKARLQQACDAATLAGRRAVGDGTFSTNALQQANRLFNANFAPDFLGSQNTVFTATSENNGNTVRGVATTELPTVIMRIFGNTEINLSVECEASLDVANADITMVLDVTGSMRGARLRALQAAAKNFYNVLNSATSTSNARVRYGFVPYSQSINVGGLIAGNVGTSLLFGDNPDDTAEYPTRRGVYRAPIGPIETYTETAVFVGNNFELRDSRSSRIGSEAFISTEDCNLFAANLNFEPRNSFFAFKDTRGRIRDTSPLNSTVNPEIVTIGADTFERTYSNAVTFGTTENISRQDRQFCSRTVSERQIVETNDPNVPGAKFVRWEYGNFELPVHDYVNSRVTRVAPNNPSNLPAGQSLPPGFSTFGQPSNLNSAVWAGCIEERDTVNADDPDISFSSFSGISPAEATDLDIDSPPANDSNRWRPLWPEVVFRRLSERGNSTRTSPSPGGSRSSAFDNSNNLITDCPLESRLLRTYDQTDFDNYIDALSADGSTYHDIGLIWGARIANPDGIFAANVNDPAPNNGFVSRNLVFLTDGILAPRNNRYTSYGIERTNNKVGNNSNNAELARRHNARFLAVCEAVKAKRIRIFVVAFGTNLTPSLQTCSSPDSAFVAGDAAQLNDRFLQIATNIADLRLTN